MTGPAGEDRASVEAAELAALTAHSPVCVHRIDLDRRLSSINQAGLLMLGVSEAQVIGALYVSAVSRGDRPRVALLLEEALRGEPRHFSFRSTNGRSFSSCFLPIRRPDGSVDHLLGITDDQSLREQLTAEAARALRRVADITRTIDGIVWEADANTFAFSYVSEQAERLLGYPASRWLEPGFWVEHLHPDDRDQVIAYCTSATRAGADHEFEYRMKAADGRIVWLHDIVTVVSENGRPVRLRGVLIDVTRRKTAEAALRREEALLRSVVEDLPLGVLVVDDQAGAITLFNRRFCEIWGIEALEPAMRQGEIDYHAVLRQCAAALVDPASLAEGGGRTEEPGAPAIVEDELALAGARTVRRFTAQVRDRGDRYVGRLFFFEEITERRRMEMRLVETERLGAVGTLAAGVAHEINNPLTYVVANLAYLRDELLSKPEMAVGKHAEIQQVLAETQEGADRVVAIVRDMKVFSRRSDEGIGTASLIAALEFAARLTANERRFRARLEMELGVLPHVHGDEQQLTQLFVNLLTNASQSLPEGGADRETISVRARVDAGRVLVEIADTGSGMTREQLRRAFEPFFTTKAIGVGTGLGLFLCHGVVTRLGGEIAIESAPGRGTTVRVWLRMAAAPAERDAPVRAAGARARILVIDDDEPVLRSLSRTLSSRHEVSSVTSGEQALSLLAGGLQVDVILCDLMLRGMSGIDFASELDRSFAKLAGRVIFMTGGALGEKATDFVQSRRTLEKPIDAEQLSTAIDALMVRGSLS